MASSFKLKFPARLDEWSIRERLALACSVMRSGDQNWVSVSRAIKPYGDPNRPSEWFSQKNCAMQYAALLETVETPKRKRGDKGEVETPSLQIVRKLTIERIEELKKKVIEQQQKYKSLKKDVELVKAGEWDDKLPEVYEQLYRERQKAEEEAKAAEQRLLDDTASTSSSGSDLKRQSSSQALQDMDADTETEDTQDSVISIQQSQGDEKAALQSFPSKIEGSSGEAKKPGAPTSQCLSKLLQSEHLTASGLTQIKQETELEHEKALASTSSSVTLTSDVRDDIKPQTSAGTIADTDYTPSSAAPTLTKILQKSASAAVTGSGEDESQEPVEADESAIVTTIQPVEQEDSDMIVEVEYDDKRESEEDDIDPGENMVKKEETEGEDIQEESQDALDPANTSHLSVDEEISIKDEPLSPASSVSSKISESDIRKESRRFSRGKGSKSNKRRPTRNRKLPLTKDDETSRLSDPDSSEEGGLSDDTSTSNILNISTSAFSESIPNSPLSHCSDTEDEKAYKNWKKSIMLVWRSAANHKYANVFLHPVTNEIAPGYTSVVQRPMDLSLIKKKIESGEIRTTVEFQRDMMLMFTNAIMYNSSNHDVHKMATVMYEEVLQQIEQYVSTQLMVQGTDSKYLRGSRRADNSDKEDETKRRRTSSEQHGDGGKSKKRKTRADDA